MSDILLMAKFFIRDLLRSRLVAATIGLAMVVLLMTFLAKQFAFGNPQKVAIDVGLGFIGLAGLTMSLLLGINLITADLESKTVRLFIARGIPRSSFLCAKALSLISVQMLCFAIFTVLLTLVLSLMGQMPTLLFFQALWGQLLECALLLCVIIFFSLLSSRVIALCAALLVFTAGHLVAPLKVSVFVQQHAFFQQLLTALDWLLPAFHYLNLKDYVLYRAPLSWFYMAQMSSYAIMYMLVLLSVSIWIFQRKEIE